MTFSKVYTSDPCLVAKFLEVPKPPSHSFFEWPGRKNPQIISSNHLNLCTI